MTEKDSVSTALRQAESEVDVAFRKNPLMRLSRTQALWHFLAECEEIPIRIGYQSQRDGIVQDPLAVVDYLANLAKWPVIWIWKTCTPSSGFKREMPDDSYGAAVELAKLGHNYLDYQTVFTYASKDLLSLTLEGKRIRASGAARSDTKLDAYDRIVSVKGKMAPDPAFTPWLMDRIRPLVRVNGNRFGYRASRRLMNDVLARSRPLLDSRFRLPADWAIPVVSLGDYFRIQHVLWCMCCVHLAARRIACDSGCVGLGYLDSVLTVGKSKLLNEVSQYSGVELSVVGEVLDQLTLGSLGQTTPDIVLQPLVPLACDSYGIAPSLVANSHLERNLLALLNRLDGARDAYSRLSTGRERIHRKRIQEELQDLDLRFAWGRVPGWEDASEVDLAIVDSAGQTALILELKSFVEPADPREVYQKSLEIRKGIRQIRDRKQRTTTHRRRLNDFLDIDDSCTVFFAVASESSVACGLSRAPDVPLVRSADLVGRIRLSGKLRTVCEVIDRGEHLPREGVDYFEHEKNVEVAGWTLEWYANRLP